jgi:formylglycine-generating enzyme required for sulfatase activity
VELGKTTLPLEDLEPGPVTFQLSLPGYEPITVSGEVGPGEQTFLSGSFVKRAGPQFDAPWENSLGMHFVPVGEVLMAVWPTRIRDYEVYCQFTGAGRQAADFEQDPNHPQVKVSWDDAMAFCDWLTQQERDSGHLASNQLYRLPTDLEWSLAAGLESERGATPEQRDGKIRGFPWGDQWPPPARAGNFADGSPRRSRIPTIAGYTDGHPATSPVGSFDPNKNGLHDICGNVWEWILDSYKPGSRWGVLRGGSWASASSAELRTSYRNVVDRSERDVIYGFRVVITAASSD